MTDQLTRPKIVGVLSAIPSAYFWLGIALGALWKVSLPFNLGLNMFCILLSVVTSIWAARHWVRWMYVVTLVAVTTAMFVMLRLH